MTIRPITLEDSDALLELRRALDEETTFMMLAPGERTTTPAEQRNWLEQRLAKGRDALFAAEVNGVLAGYISLDRGNWRRNAHSGYIVMGVRQAYAGQGLGRALFEALLAWAAGQPGLHRLELTVMTHNARAVALYQKMGFEIEGLRKHSLQVDGAWVDEYEMAKLI